MHSPRQRADGRCLTNCHLSVLVLSGSGPFSLEGISARKHSSNLPDAVLGFLLSRIVRRPAGDRSLLPSDLRRGRPS
jgi:hypothetical protein